MWSNSCDTLGVIAGLQKPHAAVRSAFVIITSELQGKIPVSYAKSSNSPPQHGMIEKMPYVDRGVSCLRTHRSTSLQGVFRTMFSVRCGAVVVPGCEHKSVENRPIRRNYYVCNRFFILFSAATGPIYANIWLSNSRRVARGNPVP